MEISTASNVTGLRSLMVGSPAFIQERLAWVKSIPDDAYLSPEQAAAFLTELGAKISTATLNTWRSRRSNGPTFTKIHSRVMYRAGDLRTYVEAAKSAAA